MNKIVSFLTVAATALCIASCTEPELPDNDRLGADVVLQWNTEEQTIDGFGIAQAGWSQYLYAHQKRDEIMNMFFGQDGMRLSILRGEVFPDYDPVTFNMDADIDMPLSDPFFDIDFNAAGNEAANIIAKQKGQRWVMKKAKEQYNVDKLIFAAWTPPASMKSNGSQIQGTLKTDSYQAFADYLTNFCTAYNNAGLPVYAISPANEPEFAAEWNSCLWLPGFTTLAPFIINDLGPKMAAANPSTKIIFGENGQWSAILGFILGSRAYVRDILNIHGSELTKFPLIAAGHGYIDPVTKQDPAILPFDEAEGWGIPVWVTEISDPNEPYDASMTSGLKWARKFHSYLCEANVGAIVWWAGALPDGWSTEGLINIDKNRQDYEISKRCEVFGNFSRYIPVGSKRISAQYDSSLGWMVSGYKYGNSYTAVAINPSDSEITINVALNGAQPIGDLQGYITDSTRKWEVISPVQSVNGLYSLTLPAQSVVSYTGTIQ